MGTAAERGSVPNAIAGQAKLEALLKQIHGALFSGDLHTDRAPLPHHHE